jgi:hypothetical protein
MPRPDPKSGAAAASSLPQCSARGPRTQQPNRLLRGRNRGAETRFVLIGLVQHAVSRGIACVSVMPRRHTSTKSPRADCCDRSTVRPWLRSRKARPGARVRRLRIGSAANPEPLSFQPTARPLSVRFSRAPHRGHRVRAHNPSSRARRSGRHVAAHRAVASPQKSPAARRGYSHVG